jgi:hypothetical protein
LTLAALLPSFAASAVEFGAHGVVGWLLLAMVTALVLVNLHASVRKVRDTRR